MFSLSLRLKISWWGVKFKRHTKHKSKLSSRESRRYKWVVWHTRRRYRERDIPPSNILDYDETNLSDDPGKAKCIAKTVFNSVMSSTKSSKSIMFACTSTWDFKTGPIQVRNSGPDYNSDYFRRRDRAQFFTSSWLAHATSSSRSVLSLRWRRRARFTLMCRCNQLWGVFKAFLK